MSNYTTIAALRKRIKASTLASLGYDSGAILDETAADTLLTSDAGTMGNINQAIIDASLIIDHTLNGCLDMTDSAVQEQMEMYCSQIALHLLFMRRHNSAEEESSYFSQYKWSLGRLKDIATRKLKIGVGPEAPASQAYSTTMDSTWSTDSALGSDALENF